MIIWYYDHFFIFVCHQESFHNESIIFYQIHLFRIFHILKLDNREWWSICVRWNGLKTRKQSNVHLVHWTHIDHHSLWSSLRMWKIRNKCKKNDWFIMKWFLVTWRIDRNIRWSWKRTSEILHHFIMNQSFSIKYIYFESFTSLNLTTGNDDRYVSNVRDVRYSVFESLIRSIEHRKLELHRKFPKTESLKVSIEVIFIP